MRGEVNKLKILIALIIFFQGFSIAVISHPLLKTSPWLRILGWLMMAFGVGYIYFIYQSSRLERAKREKASAEAQEQVIYYNFGRGRGRDARVKAKLIGRTQIGKTRQTTKSEQIEESVEDSILTKLMTGIVKRSEAFSSYTLPIIGALIIDGVIIYNILQGSGLDLKSWDLITILFGVSLITYNYVPENLTFARDFFVFFLGLLFLILIFPPIFYELIFGGEGSGSAQVTKILLADPVSGLLNLVGVDSSTGIEVNSVTGNEIAYIYFPLLGNGETAGVGIGEACSGIYTASIFLAAFITFVLIEYKRFDLKVGVIIGLGILTTYIANILRMTIIVLVGHYYDTVAVGENSLPNMNWAHANAGWLIFMAWIIPFWFLMYRFLMRKDLSGEEPEEDEATS